MMYNVQYTNVIIVYVTVFVSCHDENCIVETPTRKQSKRFAKKKLKMFVFILSIVSF